MPVCKMWVSDAGKRTIRRVRVGTGSQAAACAYQRTWTGHSIKSRNKPFLATAVMRFASSCSRLRCRHAALSWTQNWPALSARSLGNSVSCSKHSAVSKIMSDCGAWWDFLLFCISLPQERQTRWPMRGWSGQLFSENWQPRFQVGSRRPTSSQTLPVHSTFERVFKSVSNSDVKVAEFFWARLGRGGRRSRIETSSSSMSLFKAKRLIFRTLTFSEVSNRVAKKNDAKRAVDFYLFGPNTSEIMRNHDESEWFRRRTAKSGLRHGSCILLVFSTLV